MTQPDGRRLLRACLAAGLLVRLVILSQTTALGTEIVDERHYSQLAGNLLNGNGFAWAAGAPTSIRPPLYPGMVAAIWSAAGQDNFQAIRLAQIILALATTGVVYLLGARVYNPRIGRYAAAVFWLYPSLIYFNFLVLTETLFTFLLATFLLLAVMLIQTPRAWIGLLCGVSLGLAALTRSILWPVPLVLCPLLAAFLRVPLARRMALPLLVLAGYALVVAPWAIRNTKLQGVVTIVDTMGGINLRMGNYEYTPDDRMWDAVALRGEQNWVYGLTSDEPGVPMTEGRKEKWAQRKALEYMRQHPGVTVRRALIKFADFWGLEREFVAGVRNGLLAPPLWFEVLATVAIMVSYVGVVIAGAFGLWLTSPADRRLHVLLLMPIVIIAGLHTIVFGHSRYHVPLVPILSIYAAAFLAGRLSAIRLASRPKLIGAMATVAVLAAIWVRQIGITDASRIGKLLHLG